MLDDVLASELVLPSSATEAQYCESWRAQVAPLWPCSPFDLAGLGGRLAFDFATVFVAGYQAAIRVVFPQTVFEGIVALAVSEDRSKVDPLPGVTWQEEIAQYRLEGTKSWVAASREVEQIVVKAKGMESGESAFFLVQVPQAGLEIENNPQPSMLPKLSQGRAHLKALQLDHSMRLDSTLMPQFGLAEALCIYAAFVAMVWQTHTDENLRAKCQALLEQLRAINLNAPVPEKVVQVDQQVNALRQNLADTFYAEDAAWQADQKLVAMYSAGLQKSHR